VTFRNGSGPEAAATVLEARKNVGIGNAAPSKPPPTIRKSSASRLTGSDTCTAGGLTGRGHAPILMLCRLLLTAGIDPDESLEVRSRRFGNISVELDAINPDRLRALVQGTIERHLPPRQFEVLKAAEASEREIITKLVAGLGS
jgi:hypothetical protein